MGQRSIQCGGCGAAFPIPEIPPSVVHCPRCGDRISFGTPGDSAVQVREDIREPIRPLPPSNPYFPLTLLLSAGFLIACSLVGAVYYFTRLEPHPGLEEGVRAKRREAEPLISIREIPVLPVKPKSPPIQVDLSKVPPLIPEPLADPAGPLGKAQLLGIRANLSGLVLTILTLTGKLDEAGQVEAELARDHEEIRVLLAPMADRPEVRSMKDYFKPGDELVGFGNLPMDPFHPLLFADAIRTWLSEAQGGALVLATLYRDGRTLTLTMWFPEFSMDLTQRVLPTAKQPPK